MKLHVESLATLQAPFSEFYTDWKQWLEGQGDPDNNNEGHQIELMKDKYTYFRYISFFARALQIEERVAVMELAAEQMHKLQEQMQKKAAFWQVQEAEQTQVKQEVSFKLEPQEEEACPVIIMDAVETHNHAPVSILAMEEEQPLVKAPKKKKAAAKSKSNKHK